MCTACMLTISHSIRGGGGGGRMQTPQMQTPDPPPKWTKGMTDACENITLPQILFAGGNKT